MEPLTAKQRVALRKAFAKEFAERVRGFDMPRTEDLEAMVEGNTKCQKCSGQIRAMCKGATDPASSLDDLDVIMTLYCPKPDCGHMTTQYRPWRRSAPREL